MASDLNRLTGKFDSATSALGMVLGDLSNEQAGKRMRDGKGSSISFIVGHLMASRATVLSILGAREDNPWGETFGGNSPARDLKDYPPIAELVAQWNELGEQLHSALAGLSDKVLLADGPEWLPGEDKTNRGMLEFFVWHEIYHFGQVGLMRTEQGLPSIQELMHPESLEETPS